MCSVVFLSEQFIHDSIFLDETVGTYCLLWSQALMVPLFLELLLLSYLGFILRNKLRRSAVPCRLRLALLCHVLFFCLEERVVLLTF